MYDWNKINYLNQNYIYTYYIFITLKIWTHKKNMTLD